MRMICLGRWWLVLGNRSIVSFRTLIDDAGIEHQDLVLLRLVTCSYVYPYMPTGVEINYCCKSSSTCIRKGTLL